MKNSSRYRGLPRVFAALTCLSLVPWAVGDVTYSFNFSPPNQVPSPGDQAQIEASVAEAASIFNTYGSFNMHWNVYYNSGTTAEASYGGYMAFGSQRTTRTAMHEGSHTFGMGTGPNYANLIAGNVWGGEHGNQAQFDTYNTYSDGLHGDGHAIWPGGMNYENEFTDNWIFRVWSTRVQAGLRCDMGIMAFNQVAVITIHGANQIRQ